jgi:copper chaperone CopZ
MDRRKFLCRVTAASTAAGLAGAQPRGVTYKIEGYTCITCAVGLEVMLRELKGVKQAHANYPDRNVAIEFDEKQVAEKTIVDFIQKCGFEVAE